MRCTSAESPICCRFLSSPCSCMLTCRTCSLRSSWSPVAAAPAGACIWGLVLYAVSAVALSLGLGCGVLSWLAATFSLSLLMVSCRSSFCSCRSSASVCTVISLLGMFPSSFSLLSSFLCVWLSSRSLDLRSLCFFFSSISVSTPGGSGAASTAIAW